MQCYALTRGDGLIDRRSRLLVIVQKLYVLWALCVAAGIVLVTVVAPGAFVSWVGAS